jgi:hypothetical protein
MISNNQRVIYRGAGFFDYIKNVFSSNDRYTNKAESMLKKYGNYNVIGIVIEKSPIISAIDKALNLISLGKWAEAKKKYNYDDLYHLYLILTLDLGEGKTKKILLEKNQSINISESIPSRSEKTQSLNIFPPKNITLNNLLLNTLNRVGKDQFFIYDPFGGRNCQNFVKDVFTSNDLYNDRINKFVFQPIQELKKDLGGFTTGFSKGVTDIAAFGERLIGLGKDEFVLHAVIVKKPVSMEELHKIQADFVKGKGRFIRETEGSYRIRIVPKTKFIKKSYRSKIISQSPHITLIFGKLL